MGKGLQQVLHRRENSNNKQVKRYSTSLVIMEIQIKITLICHHLIMRLEKNFFKCQMLTSMWTLKSVQLLQETIWPSLAKFKSSIEVQHQQVHSAKTLACLLVLNSRGSWAARGGPVCLHFPQARLGAFTSQVPSWASALGGGLDSIPLSVLPSVGAFPKAPSDTRVPTHPAVYYANFLFLAPLENVWTSDLDPKAGLFPLRPLLPPL